MSEAIVVKTVEELKGAPEEYREAVAKLVISHAVNELYGAQVFDEPAIEPNRPAVELRLDPSFQATAIDSPERLQIRGERRSRPKLRRSPLPASLAPGT